MHRFKHMPQSLRTLDLLIALLNFERCDLLIAFEQCELLNFEQCGILAAFVVSLSCLLICGHDNWAISSEVSFCC